MVRGSKKEGSGTCKKTYFSVFLALHSYCKLQILRSTSNKRKFLKTTLRPIWMNLTTLRLHSKEVRQRGIDGSVERRVQPVQLVSVDLAKE